MTRNPVPFQTDTRGVNTSVAYVISLGITTILISMLIMSTGTFVESHQRSVVNEEMAIVGQTAANHLMDMDRTVRHGSSAADDASRTVPLPDQLAGTQYTIEIVDPGVDSATYAVRLETRNPIAEAEIWFRSETDVDLRRINGGDIEITYDEGENALVIGNA